MAGRQREENGSMSIEALADRIRQALAHAKGVDERRMFGGIAFMVDGNLALSASPNGLLVRVGSDAMPTHLKRKGARPMTMGKRTMKGYSFVDEAGMRSESDFADWIGTALTEVGSLPPKVITARRRGPAGKIKGRRSA
jgi:TfoX/Sxy family transcriptional regulator of competence genes